MLTALGYYTILERIGAGGLGEVYRARDTRVGRTVVIRLVPDEVTEDPNRRAALLEAARRAAQLSHPNVAALFEIGEDGSHLFLVFEHVSGEGLPVVLADRPLKVRRAIEFAIQLADALAEGHAQGIVHGDIRPDKILVTKTGHAKLLDFGVAAFGSGAAARAALAQGLSAGTTVSRGPVEYMAPEQILGAPGDARADVFCLGVVLYEMLTGRTPFKGASAEDAAIEILKSPTPIASASNPQVPEGVDRVLARALSKSLDARQQSAAEIASDLRYVAEALNAAERDQGETGEPGSSTAFRWRPWLIAAAAFAAIGVVGLMFSDALGRTWRHWFVAPPAPVLAVVAGEGVGSNRAQPYFVNGFLHDLADRFGHTPGFTVVSRSTIGSDGDLLQTARAEGAAVVLTSALETAGGAVTVEASLSDTSRGDVLWAGRLTKPRAEVLALQTDLVDRIAERLKVPVDATAQRVRTAARAVDPEGYDLYLHGREAARLGDTERATTLFRRAAVADPSLAETHAAYVVAAFASGLSHGSMVRELMRRAAASAAAIDADLAASQLASGLAAEGVPQAVQHMRRALEIDPSSPATLVAVGDEISGLDPARALDFYRAAAKLDPRRLPAHLGMARVHALLGQTDVAERELTGGSGMVGGDVTGRALSLLLVAYRDPKAVSLPDGWTPPPAYALKVAMALGDSRPDLATALAGHAARTAPEYCEARAVVAALDREGRSPGGAKPLENTRPADVANSVCAAVGAAAAGNAQRTAELLQKIAGDAAALRVWLRPVGGASMNESLRASRYPWTKVNSAPSVADAIKRLDRVVARTRGEVNELLRNLPRE